ncbi:uncharacterized protein IL334_001057 [Kwoniella shivajii]|uniref:PCI domain-containing protein n=1 Tax=Kwoniella shivajii TaxID=564305 RepID=A0ABZ1CR21_9TREE|nr:hypothetical protein IL334_001057 [Kwoniella shivajii]
MSVSIGVFEKPTIGTYVNHISECFRASSSDNLINSIPFTSDHPFYRPLAQAVIHPPSTSSSTSTSTSTSTSGNGFAIRAVKNIPDDPINQSSIAQYLEHLSSEIKENLSSFIVAVLKNVRGNATESNEEYGDFIRLHQVHIEANKLYGMTNEYGYIHAFMNPLIVKLAKSLVVKSNRAASVSNLPLRDPKSSRSIRDTTRQVIERSMQISNTTMTESDWNSTYNQQHLVGDIVWELGNILFRIYAERKLHTQAAELSRSLESLTPHEQKRFSSRGQIVPATVICQNYYWRGRIRLILLDFRTAKYWLDKAWNIVPQNQHSWNQRRAILLRLIPVNLLLGQVPSQTLLQEYNLPHFLPLIHAFRTGNIPLWRNTLEGQKEWLRRRSIWLILYERGEILVWRNLLRNTLRMYYQLDPTAPKNKCPTWIFISVMHKTFLGSGEVEDGNIELEDIICVISSLIDHGLVLGFLSYSHRQLVMKPSPHGFGGFPKISTVEPRKTQAIA